MTFSCRVHESSDQFVDPVSTPAPSRTANLWCMRSGMPETARVGIGSAAMSSGTHLGGGGTGIGLG